MLRTAGLILIASLMALPGCSDRKDSSTTAAAAAEPAEKVAEPPKHEGREDWIPKEHAEGGNKWRDAAVYVDGLPVGVIWFGELPSTLTPVWVDGIAMGEFRAGEEPTDIPVKYRRYRIAEYLEALGIDLAKAKEVHIYGGRAFPAVIPAAELRRVRDDFHFSFGRETAGKPLLHFPDGMKINTTFDMIAGIAVYINRKAPVVRDDGYVELDGKIIEGIPYFGDPVRGGIRIYKDDRLATVIKRHKLEEETRLADKGPNGERRWNLARFLEAQGIDTSDLVEAALIFDERRVRKLDREELVSTYFVANPQSGGEILLGDKREPVQALAVHTKSVPLEMAALADPPTH